MKITEVIQLLKAGYTKSEIQDLMREPAPAEPEGPAEPTDPAPEAPDPAPAPAAPAEPAAPSQTDQEITELRRLVDNLTKLVQQQNIRNSSMPAPKSPEQTAEDILASIINPMKEEK